jgi:hypothetical protein
VNQVDTRDQASNTRVAKKLAMLAKLRDKRIRGSEETIIRALRGDYRREHLFTLRQSLEAYRYRRRLIADCDKEIEQSLAVVESKIDVQQHPMVPENSYDADSLGVALHQVTPPTAHNDDADHRLPQIRPRFQGRVDASVENPACPSLTKDAFSKNGSSLSNR